MDSFTYLVAVFLLAFAMQYSLFWLALVVLAFLLISLRSLSGIVLTLVTGTTFFLLGSSLQGEILFISVGLVFVAYFIGVKPAEEQGGGMSPDMMAALQGMEGMGGGGMGGFH